jgi:hypothetical protein
LTELTIISNFIPTIIISDQKPSTTGSEWANFRESSYSKRSSPDKRNKRINTTMIKPFNKIANSKVKNSPEKKKVEKREKLSLPILICWWG